MTAAAPDMVRHADQPQGERESNGAPSADRVQSLVRALMDEQQAAHDWMAWCDLVLADQHVIQFPDGVQNPTAIKAGVGSQQLSLLDGLFSPRPLFEGATSTTTIKDRDRVQRITNFLNALPLALEKQQGEQVYHRVRRDQLVHGVGVLRFDYLPQVHAKSMPTRKSGESASSYLGRRNEATQKSGAGRGVLPFRLAHVSANSFYHDSDPLGGLSVAIEVRTRRLEPLLRDERYLEALPILRGRYGDLKAEYGAVAERVLVRFVVVETPEWCSFLILPEVVGQEQQINSLALAQAHLANDYALGELADQYPNELGRVHYSILPGQVENNDPFRRRHAGALDKVLPLAVIYDHFLSHRYTRHKQFVFAPWIGIPQTTSINGAQKRSGKGDGGEAAKIQFKANELTIVPDPITIQPMTNPGAGPDEESLENTILRELGKHCIPESVYAGMQPGTGRSAGYAIAQQIATTRSKHAPIAEGTQFGWRDFGSLVLDTVEEIGEPVELMGIPDSEGVAAWIKLDPATDLAGDWQLGVHFEFERDEDKLVALQAFTEAVQGRAMTRVQARKAFLSRFVKDAEKVEDDLLIQDYGDSDDVRKLQMQSAVEKAGALVKQKVQAQQAPTSADFAQANPQLNAALAQLVAQNPNTPGAQALQQWLEGQGHQPFQQSQGGQPPQMGMPPTAPPRANSAPVRHEPPPATPQRQGRPNGRAGQNPGRASGPHRGGGLA